jgi:hypothetical protein
MAKKKNAKIEPLAEGKSLEGGIIDPIPKSSFMPPSMVETSHPGEKDSPLFPADKIDPLPAPKEEEDYKGGPRCHCGKEMEKTTEIVDGDILPYWVCLGGSEGHDAYPA